jgi:hypothetical protein
MTERQDLRPLSTEDLLPDDRTRTDEGQRSDRPEGGTGEGRTYQAQHADDRTDEAQQLDDDRAAGSDQYDETRTGTGQYETPAGTNQYDRTRAEGDQHDEAVAQDDTTVARDNDTTLAQDGVQQQRPSTDDDDTSEPLFTVEEVDRFRVEWRELQSDFVDHPRDAVQHADELVAQVMQSLATTFADHKRSLEGQWSAGEKVETEELRVALRRYRAFFDQLLTV